MLLVLPMLMLGLTGCGTEIDNQISNAADAIDNEDYYEGQSICDKVMDNYWGEMTIENKCEMACLYAVLYGEMDEAEDEHNIDMCRKCYTSAMEEDSDAAQEYLNSMEDGLHEAIDFILEMYDLGSELEDLGNELEDWDF